MKHRRLTDTHHAYPRSTFPQYATSQWNLRTIVASRHAAYHQLFGNASPCEAALMLLKEFGPKDEDDLYGDPWLESIIKFLTDVGR